MQVSTAAGKRAELAQWQVFNVWVTSLLYYGRPLMPDLHYW